MSRLHCIISACAALCACDTSRSHSLGDYVPEVRPQAEQVSTAAAADAGALVDPQLDAAAPALDAGAAVPSPPAASISPPTTSSVQPTSSPAVMQAVAAKPLGKPDYVAVAERAVPRLKVGTEQHFCMATDLTVKEDTWVTAIEVAPQHADYTFRATVTFGETCDALGIDGHNVFDYFPQNTRIELGPGDAFRLPASSRISVQLHYSTLAAKTPSTDTTLTEVRLWTLPKGERPQREVSRAIFHLLNISIPIGAEDVEITGSAELDAKHTRAGAEIIGIAPDVHYLGQKVTSTLVDANGAETTVLDLQNWSIESRKDYLLDPSKYIPVSSGALHKHTCVYSNRPDDQALDANGRPMTPQLTSFGEESRNEQCRMAVLIRQAI